MTPPTARDAFRHGARTGVPLCLALTPFGLVYGAAVAESSIDAWLGVAASWIVLAGAAQLTLLSLIEDGAAWWIAVGTALLINARFALYSTALAPAFGAFPAGWRLGLPYLLTDQSASLALVQFERDDDPVRRRWWYLGAGLVIVSGWWAGTVIGVVAGGVLPDRIDIGFAVPVMFLALLVPSITDRPGLLAAAVAGVVAVASSGLPSGLNIVAGALSGIAVGRLTVSREAPA